MIVDSSALVAILFKEMEAFRLADAITRSLLKRLPASCFLEASMLILSRRKEEGWRDLDQFIARSEDGHCAIYGVAGPLGARGV